MGVSPKKYVFTLFVGPLMQCNLRWGRWARTQCTSKSTIAKGEGVFGAFAQSYLFPPISPANFSDNALGSKTIRLT